MKKILNLKSAVPFLAAGLFCFSQGISAQPNDVSVTSETAVEASALTLTPEEKAVLRQNMEERLQAMTPEQRKEAFDKVLQELTPEQKAMLKKKMQERWAQMTPQQKKDMLRKMSDKMTPEQKEELKSHLKMKWDSMTAEQQQEALLRVQEHLLLQQ